MKHRVVLSDDAIEDLVAIHKYTAEHRSLELADRLLESLEHACAELESHPWRGRVPPELGTLGIAEFREVVRRPYRVFYTIVRRTVTVLAVLDGRRSLTDLLADRLLR
jgi:toxin ParE1/3/4